MEGEDEKLHVGMEALFDFKRIDTSPKLVSPSFVAPSEGRIFQPAFMLLLEEEEKVHSVEYKDRHRGSYIFTATSSLTSLFFSTTQEWTLS